MARRSRRSFARKTASFSRKGGAGMDGLIAGAAGNLLNLGSPIGNAAVLYGVGRWRKNSTLETIAGIQAGRALLAPGALGGVLGGLTGSTPTTGTGMVL